MSHEEHLRPTGYPPTNHIIHHPITTEQQLPLHNNQNNNNSHSEEGNTSQSTTSAMEQLQMLQHHHHATNSQHAAALLALPVGVGLAPPVQPTTLAKPKRMCRFPGCTKVIKSQGHCQRHGARAKRCRVDGCDKQAQGRFYTRIHIHYSLWEMSITLFCDTNDRFYLVHTKHLNNNCFPSWELSFSPGTHDGMCKRHWKVRETLHFFCCCSFLHI